MDQGFISMALDQAKEPTIAEEGSYDLVIEKAEIYKSKNSGKTSIRCIIGFADHPEHQSIFHYVSLPAEGDEPETLQTKLLMAKRFLTAFSIAFEEDGFNVEDFGGARATLLVKQEMDNQDRLGNAISTPKLDS